MADPLPQRLPRRGGHDDRYVLRRIVIAHCRHAFDADHIAAIGTLVSGVFLVPIGLLNLSALVGLTRLFRRMRTGALDEAELERQLNNRGSPGPHPGPGDALVIGLIELLGLLATELGVTTGPLGLVRRERQPASSG